VSPVNIAQKVAAAWNALVRQIKCSRTGAALVRAISATARSFGHVAHQLWLEVTGFTFLAIAGIGAISSFREYNRLQSGQVVGRGRLALAICFTLTFAWFGLTSFWRVRRMASRNRRQQA